MIIFSFFLLICLVFIILKFFYIVIKGLYIYYSIKPGYIIQHCYIKEKNPFISKYELWQYEIIDKKDGYILYDYTVFDFDGDKKPFEYNYQTKTAFWFWHYLFDLGGDVEVIKQ